MASRSSRNSVLEEALLEAEQLAPAPVPRPLPAGHITTARNLPKVLETGALRPRRSKAMRKKAVFLFYGGLFYRGAPDTTMAAAGLPVGFLFHPKASRTDDEHYPFDTGAMAKGLYGPQKGALRHYKKNLKATSGVFKPVRRSAAAPRLIIKHIFSTNWRYLEGKPAGTATGKPEPIPELFRFYTAPNDKSDHRRACIEIQRRQALHLNDNLLWIGYPDSFEDLISDLLDRIDPHVPMLSSYPDYGRFRPDLIAAELHGRAWDVIAKFGDLSQ